MACLAAQSIAAGPVPSGTTAIVSGGPGTTVGDVHVVTTMAAFPGDVVETHSDHFSRLTLEENGLTLLGKSKIQLLPNAANLMSGGIVVSTDTKYEVRTDCFSVVPVSKSTKFSVTPYEGRIYVYAEQGDAVVRKTKPGQREVRVPQGKTLAIANACKPGERMDFAGQSDTAFKIAMGAAAASGVAVVCSLPQDISPDKRKKTCGSSGK
jgi:hypothetical protein